ncbi:MAG: hypothetical protein NTY81_01290 [Candidatus Staskawiczbacteria bacterium]|nr:hypothetical protein [Candidatus Staskawiczbacteria bacterium]
MPKKIKTLIIVVPVAILLCAVAVFAVYQTGQFGIATKNFSAGLSYKNSAASPAVLAGDISANKECPGGSSVICISKVLVLDENKNQVEDITKKVESKDNNWAEIKNNYYIRIVFEKQLTSKNDITMFAKTTNWQEGQAGSKIEVYAENNEKPIGEFLEIRQARAQQFLLTNLKTPTDTFDLRVIPAQAGIQSAGVDIDEIVDPAGPGIALSAGVKMSTGIKIAAPAVAGASIIGFKRRYPDSGKPLTLIFTQRAEVGDVIVIFTGASADFHYTATDSLTNTYTEQNYVAGNSSYITCLTAPVTTAGIPTVYVPNDVNRDLGATGWIVRGLSSGTYHKTGSNYGTGTSLTVPLTTTVQSSMFIYWLNESTNVWSGWLNVTSHDNDNNNNHYDASGHTLDVATGSQTPGATFGSSAVNTILVIYLPE